MNPDFKEFRLIKYKTNNQWKNAGEYQYVLVNSKNYYRRFHESLKELVWEIKEFEELKLSYFQFLWKPEDNLNDDCELLLTFNEFEEFLEFAENNPELLI